MCFEHNKDETCCFSGYRPEKFSFRLVPANPQYQQLKSDIRAGIADAAADGFQYFLCGMARGFDILCGETVLAMREERNEWRDLQLIAVIPFPEHSKNWSEAWRLRHAALEVRSDELIYTSEKYHANCYFERNKYMVDHASRLICYCDGKNGGTACTMKYAKAADVPVINLAVNQPNVAD